MEGGAAGSAGRPCPPGRQPLAADASESARIEISGSIPPEHWNRIGTKILARLKSAGTVNIDVEITLNNKFYDMSSNLKFIIKKASNRSIVYAHNKTSCLLLVAMITKMYP